MSDAEFQRGREEGRVDEVLRQHGAHLERINGSIDHSTAAMQNLVAVVQELREDARLREERVETARKTLADETERRRSELADMVASGDRQFTRRERLLAACLSLAVLAFGVAQFLLK